MAATVLNKIQQAPPCAGCWVSGLRLRAADRYQVLARHTERNTLEHPAPGLAQFGSDLEWLERTLFAVTTEGKLDERYATCYSWPTWPENPERG